MDPWKNIAASQTKKKYYVKNRGFRTNNHAVATYEQNKKGLSYLYAERNVESDGVHTQPLSL